MQVPEVLKVPKVLKVSESSLSPKQAEHLRNQLDTYARDFDALVRDRTGQAREQAPGQTSNREIRDDEAA